MQDAPSELRNASPQPRRSDQQVLGDGGVEPRAEHLHALLDELGVGQLVGLGEHQPERRGVFDEEIRAADVEGAQLAADIQQHPHAAQVRHVRHVIGGELDEAVGLGGRGAAREAVAGQVHQRERALHAVEVERAGVAWLRADAGDVAAQYGVQQRALAHVAPPCEGHLRAHQGGAELGTARCMVWINP